MRLESITLMWLALVWKQLLSYTLENSVWFSICCILPNCEKKKMFQYIYYTYLLEPSSYFVLSLILFQGSQASALT